MTLHHLILGLDTLTDLLLIAGLVLLVWRLGRLPLPARYILPAILGLSIFIGENTVLQWRGMVEQAEALEDLLMPLIPTLWLFLFVVELQRADRDRLAASEARYRALVQNAAVAVIAVDPQRAITLWNRGAEVLFGYADSEVLGKSVSLIYPEEIRRNILEEVLPVLDREGTWFGERPMMRKDGTRFTGSISLGRVFGPQHETLATLGVLMDATEHVQVREQLIQAQKMETVGTLAGGMAHDFNNLLTAIQGFAGLLKGSLPPGSDDYDSVVNIEHASMRGAQLVRQLMNFSHRQPTRAVPVDLNEIVQETCEFVERTFPRTIEVLTRLDERLGSIRGDSTQMHQVIMNLAVNARDAMPQGGRLVIATQNLDLAADDPRAVGLRPGPCVCLTVSDTGQGIPADVLPRIFEPFFTTKPASLGTGLGLATVYAIVKRHGGAVTVKSEVGSGTTFSIVFPRLEPCLADAGTAGSPEPAAAR